MKESLTNFQIAFVLYGAVVGYNIMILPKDVAELGGTRGWISLVIITFAAILVIAVYTYLGWKFQGGDNI